MNEANKLLTPAELDRILRYPRGRSARLAKAGKLECVKLPDGEIRFTTSQLRGLIGEATTAQGEGMDHVG